MSGAAQTPTVQHDVEPCCYIYSLHPTQSHQTWTCAVTSVHTHSTHGNANGTSGAPSICSISPTRCYMSPEATSAPTALGTRLSPLSATPTTPAAPRTPVLSASPHAMSPRLGEDSQVRRPHDWREWPATTPRLDSRRWLTEVRRGR